MKFTVKFIQSNKSAQFVNKLENFDAMIEPMVREVMARTLLKAIQDRYQANKVSMGTYEENESAEVQSPGGIARRAKVRAALATAHSLRRAFFFEQVADLLTNSNRIKTIRSGNELVALMGNIRELDAVKSPSAIQFLSGKRTRSPYNILWRQMEFGTGILRKPGPTPFIATRYTSDQGWWYGPPNTRGAIHFRGTHPGNLLRTQTGLPYSEDALAFTKLFGQRLGELLKG